MSRFALLVAGSIVAFVLVVAYIFWGLRDDSTRE